MYLKILNKAIILLLQYIIPILLIYEMLLFFINKNKKILHKLSQI